MKTYHDAIQAFLANHTPDLGDADIHSLLDLLWKTWTERDAFRDDTIDAQFMSLEQIFESLPPDRSELLFSTICDLCQRTERHAFLEGVHVGMRLYSELSE